MAVVPDPARTLALALSVTILASMGCGNAIDRAPIGAAHPSNDFTRSSSSSAELLVVSGRMRNAHASPVVSQTTSPRLLISPEAEVDLPAIIPVDGPISAVVPDGLGYLVLWGPMIGTHVWTDGGLRESMGKTLMPKGATDSFVGTPAMAWNGECVLLVWFAGQNTSRLEATRITPGGDILDDPPLILSDPCPNCLGSPVVTSNGHEFLIAWPSLSDAGSYYDIRLGRIDGDAGIQFPFGVELGAGKVPALASDGDGYLVLYQSWGPTPGTVATRLDSQGGILDQSPLPVTSPDGGYALSFAAGWNGSSYDVFISQSTGTYESSFRRLARDGGWLDPAFLSLAQTNGPFSVATTPQFTVVGSEVQDPSGGTVYYTSWLPLDGGSTATTTMLSPTGDYLGAAKVAASGNQFLIAYPDSDLDPGVQRYVSGAYVKLASNPTELAAAPRTRLSYQANVETHAAVASGWRERVVLWDNVRGDYSEDAIEGVVGLLNSVPTPAFPVACSGYGLSNRLPTVASNGDAYLATARDSTQPVLIYADGGCRSTGVSGPRVNSISYGGGQFVLIGERGSVLRLDSNGTPLDASPLALAGGPYAFGAFTGDRFLAAWNGGPGGDLAYAYIELDGGIIQPAVGDAGYPWQTPPEGFVACSGPTLRPDGGRDFNTTDAGVSSPCAFQGSLVAVAGAPAGALLVWEDTRSGVEQVWAVLINNTDAGSETTGFPLAPSQFDQSDAVAAFDGTNFVVAWVDHRSPLGEIYSARISPAGTLLDPGGVAITASDAGVGFPAIASLMTGGTIVVFEHTRPDLRTTRIEQVSLPTFCSSNQDCGASDSCVVAACDLATQLCTDAPQPDGAACPLGTCRSGFCVSPSSILPTADAGGGSMTNGSAGSATGSAGSIGTASSSTGQASSGSSTASQSTGGASGGIGSTTGSSGSLSSSTTASSGSGTSGGSAASSSSQAGATSGSKASPHNHASKGWGCTSSGEFEIMGFGVALIAAYRRRWRLTHGKSGVPVVHQGVQGGDGPTVQGG